MNTSEYKRFLHICNKNVDNSHFELFNPKDMVHSVFDDINKLKNQAYKIRQKFIDNIVDNLKCIVYEKLSVDSFVYDGDSYRMCMGTGMGLFISSDFW